MIVIVRAFHDIIVPHTSGWLLKCVHRPEPAREGDPSYGGRALVGEVGCERLRGGIPSCSRY